MTAIIGFNCLNGVMMMADTEETTTTVSKSSCEKLYRFIFPLGTVLTGGAGEGHLIDCANQELHQAFAEGIPKPPDVALDGEIVRSALNDFARRFFSETSALDPASGFEMLIAVNVSKQQTFLFRWRGNRVLWIRPNRHEAIGSGVIQLHPMLRDFQLTPTMEVALFCGVRMMYYAKRTIQGVGGKTEAIALLSAGATLFYGIDTTEKIEKLVENFDEYLTQFIYTSVSHMALDYPEETEGNIIEGFAQVPGILKQYRDRYREILQNPTRL
jgi:hypothetical protein